METAAIKCDEGNLRAMMTSRPAGLHHSGSGAARPSGRTSLDKYGAEPQPMRAAQLGGPRRRRRAWRGAAAHRLRRRCHGRRCRTAARGAGCAACATCAAAPPAAAPAGPVRCGPCATRQHRRGRRSARRAWVAAPAAYSSTLAGRRAARRGCCHAADARAVGGWWPSGEGRSRRNSERLSPYRTACAGARRSRAAGPAALVGCAARAARAAPPATSAPAGLAGYTPCRVRWRTRRQRDAPGAARCRGGGRGEGLGLGLGH